MKKLWITVIVIICAGAVVFVGTRFLMVTTKDSIVDPRDYCGNRSNNAELYAAPPDGLVYLPMNVTIVPINGLMLIDVEDDPEYVTIELQTFDDARGRGARVLLYRRSGPADSYYTKKVFETRESEHARSVIDPNIKYHLEVTRTGLNASLKMRDTKGKPVEFSIKETLRKKWSKGFLAPIGASDAIAFEYFPLFFMKDMNFVLRKGTEIAVAIGGKERKPKKLPIPVDGEFVYFSRYTPSPIIACWNRPRSGILHPVRPKGKSAHANDGTVFELATNNGHYEIKTMRGSSERHGVSFEFSPPVPDLGALKNGTVIEGRFCAGADGVRGIVAGKYTVRRKGNTIAMEIRPQEGWQPMPGKSWVTTWTWKSALTVAPDNSVSVKSAWVREK